MKKVILLFCLAIISGFTYSQGTMISDCNTATHLIINQDLEIVPEYNSELQKDRMGNYVFFYPGENKKSAWYKLEVKSDCQISFNIYASGTSDRYNFFMYKHPSRSNFCDDVVRKKIIPIRANLFQKSIEKTGTGLSQVKKDTVENKGDELYKNAYQQAVQAKGGDVYFINVYHISGDDCGHYLRLSAENGVTGLRTADKECFNEPLQKVEKEKPMEEVGQISASEISIGSTEKSAEKRKMLHVTVSGIVTDSLTQKPQMAELKWTDDVTGKEIVAQTNQNGEYSIVLDEKVIYKLTCTVIGYKEKTSKFIRQNLNSDAMKQDFAMTQLKAGENFTLKHIYFFASTYAMKSESRPELEKLLEYMKSNEKVKIEIQGHTNGEGNIKKAKNTGKKNHKEGYDFHGNEKKLSKYRAEAIKNFLLKNGIQEDRVIAEGMGGSRMLYPEPGTLKQREANRRVEVYILSSGADLTSVLNAISE